MSKEPEPNVTPFSFRIKALTTEDGLPQNTVRCLLQSQDGYLWIGTSGGLARYDGLKFTVYSSDLAASQQNDSRIFDLLQDGDGRIWVRTLDAVAAFYKGTWERFACHESPLGGSIQTCCASRKGGLWLAMADGVKRFEHGKITRVFTMHDGLCANQAGLLQEDAAGRLWVAFAGPPAMLRWQCVEPQTGKVSELSDIVGPLEEPPAEIVPDKSGGIWAHVATGFVHWKRDGITRQNCGYVPSGVTADHSGVLWFLANQVHQVFQVRDDQVSRLDMPDLPSNDLRCLLVDREGTVWIGTGDRGLLQAQPRHFTSMVTTNSAGQKVEVYSIAPGRNGRIWFGTSDGLLCLPGGGHTRLTNDCLNVNGIPEQSLRSVLEDRAGTVWLGVWQQGLFGLRQGAVMREDGADCGSSNQWTAITLFEDRTGNLWIGSTEGLVRRSPDGHFIRVSAELHFSDQHINGVQEAPDGSIWVGTAQAGLYQIAARVLHHLTVREGLSSDTAQPLCFEPDGTLWIGTPNGLNRLRQGEVRAVTMLQGLFDNRIYSLLEDSLGYYWATCNRGIWRVRKSDLHAAADGLTNLVNCVSFEQSDGLPSSEANGECQPSTARTPDGHLWFSTTLGYAAVDPQGPISNDVPPPVVIEEVLADDELVFMDNSLTPAGLRLSKADRLQLPPGRARVLEVRYTANSFMNPAKVRFKHRLNGDDPRWREAGTRRVAFYTDLRPGEYHFEVKACNDQGLWSQTPTEFTFVLASHFWETRSFYPVCACAIIGLAAVVQAYRLRWQHRLLKVEEQHALATERTRIARDLHDDLGTALTGLALELDVASRDGKKGQPLSERLEQTAQRTRDLAERMREVVWTVNPRCDTVSSLATFLEQQVSQFLHVAGVRVRLDFPEEIPALPLGVVARHQLALGVREALTNVVRHAHATEVLVAFSIADQTLVVQVRDNGQGFRTAEISGHGLSNMRARMERIGGTFECASEPGSGTTICVRLPLLPLRASKEATG